MMALATMSFTAMVPTKDLEKAKAWYSEKVGLDPAEMTDDGGAAYEAGNGSRFLLYESQFAGTNQATTVTFRVDDVDATVAELRGRGVVFEEYDMGDIKTVDGVAEWEGHKSAWFKDSDGNIIGISDM